MQLWQLYQLLRAPVEMQDEQSYKVWWGWVESVEITTEKITAVYTLDTMYNRVAVAYTATDNGGGSYDRATTAWAQDDTSVVNFGYKELLSSGANSGSATAIKTRDTILANSKDTIPVIQLKDGNLKQPYAKINCKGWFETLKWRYYSDPDGYQQFASGSAIQDFAMNSGSAVSLAQSFTLSGNWNADTLAVNVKKIGVPADNLTVALHETHASGSIPGTLIDSGAISGTTLTENYDWHDTEITAPNLTNGTNYWIVLSRTGGYDGSNYYSAQMDETALSGSFVLKTASSAWGTRSPFATMNYRILGGAETTDQINRASGSVNGAGQFLAGTLIDDRSLVYTNQYRDGDTTCGFEIEENLALGTSTDSRMLAEVTKDRYLRVYAEPAAPADNAIDTLFILRDGTYQTATGATVPKHRMRPGQWLRMKDLLPAVLSQSMTPDPSLIFIEETDYTPDTGSLKIVTRNYKTPLDKRLRDG